MAKGHEPRKPSSPLGMLHLGHRKALKIVESLPEVKDELETTIVHKFLSVLERVHGRSLRLIPRDPNERWPDAEACEGSGRIGIEVTEILYPARACLRPVRQQYTNAVRQLIREWISDLDGLVITIEDYYQVPRYPPVSTTRGKILAQAIANQLRALRDDLIALRLGKWSFHLPEHEPGHPNVGISAFRVAPIDAGVSAEVSLSSVVIETEDRYLGLTRAIERKIRKRYDRYPGGALWLLLYETGSITVLADEGQSAECARALLSQAEHRFDEVWYLWPLPAPQDGFARRIWPAH